MGKKLTIEYVQEQFKKEGYILLIDEYKNSKQQLKYICINGHVGSMTWKNWYQGNRCAKCANENKMLNIDHIRTSFEAEDYTLLSTVYNGAFSKLKYKCSHGHIGVIRWSDWQQGSRCKTCLIEKKCVGIDNVRKSFETEGYILLTTIYINSRTVLNYICPKGHENTTTWAVWQQGGRCPECNRVVTIDKVRSAFEVEGYELLSTVYVNADEKLKYRCPFRHEHSIKWRNWYMGQRCPTCFHINNSGPGHCNWKGGISSGLYCDAWKDKEYKQGIRNRDGNKCLNPYCNSKNPSDLTIHHIDYNKKNCKPSNLITVCRSCNTKANTDRDWHKSWYQVVLKNRQQIGAQLCQKTE